MRKVKAAKDHAQQALDRLLEREGEAQSVRYKVTAEDHKWRRQAEAQMRRVVAEQRDELMTAWLNDVWLCAAHCHTCLHHLCTNEGHPNPRAMIVLEDDRMFVWY